MGNKGVFIAQTCFPDANLHFTGFSTDAPESSKSMSGLQATLIMKRDGDTLKQKTVMGPGIELDVTIKLNEVLDWKDKEENPNFHVKVYESYMSLRVRKPTIWILTRSETNRPVQSQ